MPVRMSTLTSVALFGRISMKFDTRRLLWNCREVPNLFQIGHFAWRSKHVSLLPAIWLLHKNIFVRHSLTLILLTWRIEWAPNSIPIYIKLDATLHSLFISGNCSTCFGWYFHPSSGPHTTVSAASGICHTVTAICRYRGRVGTGLSATHSILKPVPSLPR